MSESDSERTMTPPPLDLLIVGAGPVGLATAAAALQRGVKNLLVVEQARSLRPVGQGVDLLPNAYRFLCELAPDIEPSLQPFRHAVQPGKPRARYYAADATPITSVETASKAPAASLFWWQLQKLLLDILPRDILVLNHQLVDIVHDNEADLVYAKFAPDRQRKNEFKNWMGDDDHDEFPSSNQQTTSPAHSSQYFVQTAGQTLVTCAAKIIVGADGINSVARRCIYRDTCPSWEKYADAQYSGVSFLGAFAPPGAIPENHYTSLDFLDNASMTILSVDPDAATPDPDLAQWDSLRIIMTHNAINSKSPIEWLVAYQMPIDEHTARSGTDNEVQQCVTDKTRSSGFLEDIITLSKELWASREASLFRRPYSIVPAIHPPPYELHRTAGKLDYPEDFKRPWHYGRVVLVGDAAHGNPPMMGQGTGMGFEDAYVLMEALSSSHVWSGGESSAIDKDVLQQAFDKYYSCRIDRVCFLQKHVMNRISDFDLESAEEVRQELWNYSPTSMKDNTKRGV